MSATAEPAPRAIPAHLVEDLDQALDSATGSAVRRSDIPLALLGKPRPARMLRNVAEEWAMMGALWALIWLAPWWFYPPLGLLVAGRLHALGVILHDVCHMPLRRKSLAIRLLEIFAGYSIAITLDAMRYHHLRHHRDNGMPTDPYFKEGLEERPGFKLFMRLRGVILIPFWTVRPVFGLLAVALPALRNPYGRIFLQDKSGTDLTHSPEVLACARAELGQFLFQAAIVAAWIRFGSPVAYAYVLPVVTVGLLSSNRLIAEHIYVGATDRRVETIFATTRDHGLSFLGSLVLAPRNIGYHVAHHLHPQVATENLPGVRRWYLEHHRSAYLHPGSGAPPAP